MNDNNVDEQLLRKKLLGDDDDDDVEEQGVVKPTRVVADDSQSSRTPIIVGALIGLVLLGPLGALIGGLIGWKREKSGAFRRVCCSCECMLFCVLLFVGLFGFMGLAMYGFTKEVVEDFTVTTPHATYPVVNMSEHELDLVQSRVKLFVDSLLAEQPPQEPLVITQNEINGFISHSDYLRGNAMVTLSPGKIKEEYSLPMELLPGGEGRYFVGSDYVTVDESAGTMEMKMETAATHEDWFTGPILFAQLEYLVSLNKETKEQFLKVFFQQGSLFGQQIENVHDDLMDAFYQDKDNKEPRAILDGIAHVSIQEGKIVVEPRQLN